MATVTGAVGFEERKPDYLSGTPRAHAIDRWIFVFMAAWFIAIVLAGFVPDSLMKIEMVRAGLRPPFPIVLHMHAVVMGAFLLLLLTQSWLMATGRKALHMQLGVAGMVLAVVVVIVGFVLVPTMYHQLWYGAQNAPTPEAKAGAEQALAFWNNITLLQLRIGLLFPLFIVIGLKARGGNAGLHKRMMILATAIPLPAGIDRIPWLPQTMPGNPITVDLYTLLALSPMFVWDVVRNGRVHRAYWIFAAAYLPCAVVVHALWNTAWWAEKVPRLMGVM
ncbi:hypothetical protein LZ496_12490 [Sphingomonas sp. NSE70-1]|uniref:Uncharacterized protein n=1 Tax=Sphingomonas caseinilyticus TaxID=2908205 RepID=A0ABT0RXA9_9SPHN|nr:hypothetical protein [Sphingomonas caseinilyticus]MCL6699596.1 hypothetical protein [Sphingomonas caseinilyticus]